MCWALLFFMTSFNLIIPELNDFITRLDGENYKGMIFLLFSVSAAISRPFSGKLTDTIGRKKVMYIGVAFGTLVLISYPLSLSVLFFLSLRFLHGFSAGFLPTGSTAYVTDILPSEKRGVAMGIYGTFMSVGFGFGNYFSGWIIDLFGYNGLFAVAAGFCLLAGILISFVQETLKNPIPFKWSLLKVKWNDVLEPSVRPAVIVMFLSTIGTGFVFVTTSDISHYLNIYNKGHFFLFYMLSTIIVRLFSGSLSDRIGRRPTMIIGLSFLIFSLVLVASSEEWIQYTAGAIFYGVSTGITSPTIMTWMADLCPPDRRGVGSGSLFIALEIGIIIGSSISLLIYDNSFATISILFYIGSTMALLAIIYLLWHIWKIESKF